MFKKIAIISTLWLLIGCGQNLSSSMATDAISDLSRNVTDTFHTAGDDINAEGQRLSERVGSPAEEFGNRYGQGPMHSLEKRYNAKAKWGQGPFKTADDEWLRARAKWGAPLAQFRGKDGEVGPKGDTVVGPQGEPGVDGADAPLPDSAISEIIDPCGDGAGFDEVILKLVNGKFMAYFQQGRYRFLGLLTDGTYRTTDAQRCVFTIANGELTWND